MGLWRWVAVVTALLLAPPAAYVCWEHARAAGFGDAFDASRYGYVSRLEALRVSGQHSLHAVDPETGATLLHVTSDPATIAYLVSQAVDIDARDRQGLSPLLLMLQNHSEAFGAFAHFKALMAHGASAVVVAPGGRSPLHLCWERWRTISRHRLDITRALLDAGVNPALVTDVVRKGKAEGKGKDAAETDVDLDEAEGVEGGLTVLHLIARNAVFHAAASPHLLDMVQASVRLLATHRISQRNYASASSRPGNAKSTADAAVNVADPLGRTPLATLSLYASPFVNATAAVILAEALVDSGADVTQPDRFGGTPLCYAAFKGVAGLVKYLIQKRQSLQGGVRAEPKELVLCAALSPAYDLVFEKGGVLDMLATVAPLGVEQRHAALFNATWGLNASVPMQKPSRLERFLMEENWRYQRHHQAETKLLSIATQRLQAMVVPDAVTQTPKQSTH